MKLNKKGFAITAIIYSILVIVIIIMTLVLAIMSSRRQTVEKIQEKVKEEVSAKKVITIDPNPGPGQDDPKFLYDAITTQTSSSENVAFDNPEQTGLFKDQNGIYYYRGNVINNFVLLDNKCWRIVRTAENGGVRVIYSGPSTDNKCETSKSFTGYTTGSYEEIIEKIQNNDLTSIITQDVADNSLENFDMCIKTARLADLQNNPSFKNEGCDSTLSSKIGLLTADETIYAGSTTSGNNNYYLMINQPEVTNYRILTLTDTTMFITYYKYHVYINNNGGLSSTNRGQFMFRPVISLVPGIEYTTGDGQAASPYVIK